MRKVFVAREGDLLKYKRRFSYDSRKFERDRLKMMLKLLFSSTVYNGVIGVQNLFAKYGKNLSSLMTLQAIPF